LRRLDQAADVLVQRLLGISLDSDVADNVALQAIIAALDRAGLSVRHAVEICPAKPFETVFDGLAGGSRAESRAHRGVSDEAVRQLELNLGVDASDTGALEGEVIDAEPVSPPADEPHPLSDLRPAPIRRCYPPVEHVTGRYERFGGGQPGSADHGSPLPAEATPCASVDLRLRRNLLRRNDFQTVTKFPVHPVVVFLM
jgi:hypothetical protein